MADRSSGPVKPPVIDLTARNANARPEERPATPETPPPGTRERNPRVDGDRHIGTRRFGDDEGVQPNGHARFIPHDTLEVCLQELTHRELAGR